LEVERGQILRSFVAVFAVVITTASCAGGDAIGVFNITGRPASVPAAQLTATSAAEFQRILVGLRGKPVLVNIWASWCVPCRAEAPILRRAAQETTGEVVFLGVDAKDGSTEGQAFLDEFSIRYPNLADEAGAIPQLVGMRGYPTTIAIDRTGKVRGSSFGGLTENRLAALLAEIR
jgi:cytochrome c biogenesis protein CcmG/thiol:disulfide interchange protein DsbE